MVAMAMIVGAVIGALVSAVTGAGPVWIALGLGAGTAAGGTVDAAQKKREMRLWRSPPGHV